MSETELGREPVELLELIVPKCANVYGSAPCTASGSGDAKCFNTRATCQDLDNFQATPLAHLGTASLVAEQDATGSQSLNGQDPYLLEIDLRIPSDPSGVVFEIGGSGTGVYVGFTSGNLVARCGDGSGAPSTSTSNIEIDPSAIEGKQGTLIYEFGLDGSGYPEGTLYFFDPLELELTELGTNTATAAAATFDTGGYGVGTINGTAAGGGTEDETDYNGVITGVRLHASVAASVGTVTGAASNVVTDIGGTDYRVITWTGSGSISINTAISGVEYLVVAGGGGGGNNGGGGGGAGGLLTNVGGTTVTLGTGSNTITVGGGGAAAVGGARGSSGGDSSALGQTAIGGGGGGSRDGSEGSGGSGGSGGGSGGVNAPQTAGTGTVGQGNDGGSNAGLGVNQCGAGGGGAGSVGGNGVSGTSGGDGGSALSNSITGSAIDYAGGGGGGVTNIGTNGSGVSGIGSGGNGGGGTAGRGARSPASGSDGTVILRWPIANEVAAEPLDVTLTPDADAYRLKYYFDDGRKAKPSDDIYILGYLLNLSSVSSRINISAADPRYEPIGRRATVSATLSDHPHTDFPFDPYLADRTYNPLERSTFWSKFIKRHKFGKTRALARRYTGYSGQALSAMQKQTYFLDALTFDGTTSAQIQMRDYLSLTEFSKAQVPAPSTGKLDAAMDASQTTMSLTGDVLTEYPATGTVRIDEEILTYTGRTYDGSGDKTDFTGLTRGTDGSTADEHDIEEGVQLCRRYVSQRVDTVLDGLLIDDASIPQQIVDSETFTATYDESLSAYTLTTLITEPTSVSKLVGEISLQCSFYLWWDSRRQAITCQAIKPLSGADGQLTQENNIVAGSLRVLEKPKERITTIAFYYNPRDWAKDLEKPVNYKNQLIVSNSEAGYQELTETREILSRWLTTEAQANQTSSRISIRYQDVPQYIELTIDAKDRALWLGSFVTISHDAIVDAYGVRDESRRWLVIEANEVEAGHKQKITLVDVTLDGIIVSITENGIGTYTAALFGAGNAFITDASGLNPDGTTGATIG